MAVTEKRCKRCHVLLIKVERKGDVKVRIKCPRCDLVTSYELNYQEKKQKEAVGYTTARM